MVFQFDFKGPYRNIRMRLVVCDLYGLFLHSGHFSDQKRWGVPKLFWVKKNPLFTFSERDFSALKLLNYSD